MFSAWSVSRMMNRGRLAELERSFISVLTSLFWPFFIFVIYFYFLWFFQFHFLQSFFTFILYLLSKIRRGLWFWPKYLENFHGLNFNVRRTKIFVFLLREDEGSDHWAFIMNRVDQPDYHIDFPGCIHHLSLSTDERFVFHVVCFTFKTFDVILPAFDKHGFIGGL